MEQSDALADVLKTIRLKGESYFCSDFASPWGMEIDYNQNGLFHVVVRGRCWLQQHHESQPLHLDQGDIVAFPTGCAHWIGSHSRSHRLPAQQVVEQIQSGSNPFSPHDLHPVTHTLLCGSFNYDFSLDHPFLKDLPCFIHIKASETPNLDWLRTIAMVLANESHTSSPGSSVMVDRLTEVLFIQLIRFYMNQHKGNLGYISALADPQIGLALNLIHGDEEAYWNVERLASELALSRTAFTEKFSAMVGMPPKSYLVDWRMQKAKQRLQQGDDSMFTIAESSGYSSESAFSKAFKQHFEQTPGFIRRQGK